MMIANRAAALLFAVGALVQINDPDPVSWILLYLAAMAACLLGTRSWGWMLATVVGIAAALWAVTVWRSIPASVSFREMFEPMETKGGAVELAREFWGLCIIAAWMSFLIWQARKRPGE